MNGKQRANEEITEFTELYPNTDLDSIPQFIWEQVRSGERLAEAYGKYAKDRQRSAAEAKLVNEKNAAQSSGRMTGLPKKALYTAADVAAMSADDVAENYDDILSSMESAGFYS